MKLNDETNNWVDIIDKFNIVKSMVDIREEEELLVWYLQYYRITNTFLSWISDCSLLSITVRRLWATSVQKDQLGSVDGK